MEKELPLSLFKVSLAFRQKLSGEEAQRVADALEETAAAITLHNKEATDGDDWEVSLTSRGNPNMENIFLCLKDGGFKIDESKTCAIPIPEKDWLQHVHDSFSPVTVGKFFVYGSHYKGEIPRSCIPLNIDAATAFGSGEHETTRGCLMALEKLSDQASFKNILDMGCGSGILAIAAAKLWPDASITAIDIDPEAVVVTNRHAGMNGAENIFSETGDGCDSPAVNARAPYDLILANILAGPLIDMAQDFHRLLLPGGFCVLSGLLGRQEHEVLSTYEASGFSIAGTFSLEDWRALVLTVRGG